MIDELLLVSEKVGNNPLLVQGAGGNISIKRNGVMQIKASGCWLANAMKENIFVAVDLSLAKQYLDNANIDTIHNAVIGSEMLRPSIETSLHILMPHKVVFHTHPVELLAWLVLRDGKEKLDGLFQDLNYAWVEYARPGEELTYAVQNVLKGASVDVLFLGNHGLVVGADSYDQAFTLMNLVVERCMQQARSIPKLKFKELNRVSQKIDMYPASDAIIHSLALDETVYEYCNLESGVLYPDQAVFLGHMMNCYDQLLDNTRLHDEFIPFVILKGIGVFISKKAKIGVNEMLRCHAEILLRIPSNKKLCYLSQCEIESLLNWEPEQYRQMIGK